MDAKNHGNYRQDNDGEEYGGDEDEQFRKLRHIEKIDGGLKPGSKITIIGKVTADAYRMDFDLCEKTHGRTKILHFNPRFNWKTEKRDVVVCNSLTSQSWGCEERNFNFPFKKGETFKFVMRCEKDQLHFTVNEIAHGTFKYRQNLQTVKYLRILGGVDVIHVEIRN